MRTGLPRVADLHVRVVLRPARGRVRLRGDRGRHEPREDRGRPGQSLALRRPAPGRVRPVRRPRHRLHPVGAGRPPGGRARARRCLDQERHAQPDQLVQGPGRVDRAEQGARVRFQGRGVRVHRQSRQLGCRARRARGLAQLRVHPVEPGAGQGRHDIGLRRQRRRDRRQLRRRQPAVRRARGHLRLGVRQRQHATVLRRGLEDPRVRDRRAARLAHPGPRDRAGRERFAAHQDPEGLRRAAQGRAARRRAARSRVGGAGARLLTDRDRMASSAPTRSGR